MAIRLVVFDVSGTTVEDRDGAVRRAMRDALGAAGLTLRDEAMLRVSGMPKPAAIRTLIEGHGRDELLPGIDAIHADFAARMLRHYRTDPAIAPIAGVEDSFAALRDAGIAVALGSGFSREILDAVLLRCGWMGETSPIDASIASDEVARGRPYPDMIDALRARFGDVPRREVAKVGDTATDLQEGAVAGCGLIVGVLTGAHTLDMLSEQPHDAIIGSVAELPDLLRGRGLLPDGPPHAPRDAAGTRSDH